MTSYPILYARQTRDGRQTVAATLRPESTPGRWVVWADDPAQASRHVWLGSIRTAQALECGLSTADAASRFPQHAASLSAIQESE